MLVAPPLITQVCVVLWPLLYTMLGTDLPLPQALGDEKDDWDPDPHSLLDEDDIVDGSSLMFGAFVCPLDNEIGFCIRCQSVRLTSSRDM